MKNTVSICSLGFFCFEVKMWLHEWIAEKENLSIEDAKLETLKRGLDYVRSADYFALFPNKNCGSLEFKNSKHYGRSVKFYGYSNNELIGIQVITAHKHYEKHNYYCQNFKKDMLTKKGENSQILIKYPDKASIFLLSNDKEEDLGEWNINKLNELCHYVINVDKDFKLDFHQDGTREMAYTDLIRKRKKEAEEKNNLSININNENV